MNPGFFLFKEGDPGNFFYIVKDGELELTNNNNEKKILSKGEAFIELALIQQNIRSCTIKSITDVEVYCLEGSIFKEIILKMNNLDMKERIKFLSENEIFRHLEPNLIHDIAKNMFKCEFNRGQEIKEIELKDSLYIIKQGTISILNKNSNYNLILKEKEFFGLSALLFSDSKAKNIKSETYSKCFQITKGLLIDILGNDYMEKILQGICKEAMSRIKMIKLLSFNDYFPKVFALMKVKKYNKSEVVFTLDNHINRKIIFLIEGNIKNVKVIFILVSKWRVIS